MKSYAHYNEYTISEELHSLQRVHHQWKAPLTTTSTLPMNSYTHYNEYTISEELHSLQRVHHQ